MTPVSPYWEIPVGAENDPKEWLHMNTERQIVTGETSKCTVVSRYAQYVRGAIALGYIETVPPKVWNHFLTKVSSKTTEKEAVFVSRKVECNDPTKETTIVYEFLLTVDSSQNRLQKSDFSVSLLGDPGSRWKRPQRVAPHEHRVSDSDWGDM